MAIPSILVSPMTEGPSAALETGLPRARVCGNVPSAVASGIGLRALAEPIDMLALDDEHR
jgi:hypothetical protein